jgi:acetoin utilization protein AcuC
MLAYDFGPGHPLKPERLRRSVELLRKICDVEPLDPGEGSSEDAQQVHESDYIEAVAALSRGEGGLSAETAAQCGFLSSDNPPFRGMYEASLAYVAGSVAAAEAVRDGAPLAFNLSGGLHHAQRAKASGFCVFNDPAIAIAVLLERHRRVAYVDIDVHHGDGVQALFWDDPRVLTCSIHEDGRYLYPGTGFVEESGPSCTSVNVPLAPGTTGDVWLWAFEQAILRALESFQPEAIVLQLGTDAHYSDPLAHLQVAAQDWLSAVRHVGDLGLPLVALGGGGYELTAVPRMWAAASMTLAGVEFEDALPWDLADAWSMAHFSDLEPPGPSGQGRSQAESVVESLRTQIIPRIPRG